MKYASKIVKVGLPHGKQPMGKSESKQGRESNNGICDNSDL